MKTTAPILAVLCVLGSVMLMAQGQTRPQFSDKKGRFALWFSEFSIEYPDKETTVFDVSGKPAHGYSKDQNLEFSASNIKGKLVGPQGSDLRLRHGVVTGNAVLTVADEHGESIFKSAQATIDDDGSVATVTIPGSFSLVNTSSKGDETKKMTLKAAGGSFKLNSLDHKDENPLISGSVSGPVVMDVDQTGPGDTKKMYTINAERLEVHADGTDKVFTVSGNVHLSNDQEGKDNFMSDLYVSQATIVVDKDYTVKSIKTKAPGSGTLKEKKDGS